jgi:hypothetical protein
MHLFVKQQHQMPIWFGDQPRIQSQNRMTAWRHHLLRDNMLGEHERLEVRLLRHISQFVLQITRGESLWYLVLQRSDHAQLMMIRTTLTRRQPASHLLAEH